jgi:hypothetical protein
VIRFDSFKGPHSSWLARCDCGTEVVVLGSNLRAGTTRSCGCLQAEIMASRALHGHARADKRTTEYRTWLSMMTRCHNPNSDGYAKYGAAGVTVCERWRVSFEAFLADMGRKPSPRHSIDRIDNARGYEPDNCRWATPSMQTENRRSTRFVIVNGERIPLAEAARRCGLPLATVHTRLRRGMSVEDALTATPPSLS